MCTPLTPVAIRENIFGDNIAKAEYYDFSRGNLDDEHRIRNITQVASICYQSPKAIGSESLYNRLLGESSGLPSSSFEIVPVLLTWQEVMDACDKLEAPISILDEDGNVIGSKIDTQTLEIEKYGQWIEVDGCKYLLTNYRALVYDFEKYGNRGIDLRNRYNTEFECEIIKQHYKVFRFKVDFPTRSQMVRHRTNFQELCISGDTIIKTSQGVRSIKKMYTIQESHKHLSNYKYPTIKSYDFKEDVFKYVPIKEIFKTGTKKVYEVTIQFGANKATYKIKTTMDHKFLTEKGWKRLEELKVSDYVALNGDFVYRNKEWLAKMKTEFLAKGIGLKGMAIELGLNYNTLKKWLHIHKLSYTPLEVASTFNVWNKGIQGKDSHSYGQIKSDITREKISKRLIKVLGTTKGGYRKRACSHWEADFRRRKILEKFNNRCCKCEKTDKLEIDHIKPVAAYPWLAFDENNIQLLCKDCHRIKSISEMIRYKQTKRYGMIDSIKEIGLEETYDLEVDHPDHNYVANGIIVHNSRRYVSAKRVPMEHYISDKMKNVISTMTFTKKLQEVPCGLSGDDLTGFAGVPMGYLAEEVKIDYTTQQVIDICMNHYYKALEDGVKPQEARRIIPQTGYTEFWMGFLPFQLDNFFRLRDDKDHAQWEVYRTALVMKDMLGIPYEK